MKGLFFVHMGVFSILLASCLKEDGLQQEKTVLEFSIEQTQIKTAPGINDGTSIRLLWEAGDDIYVNGQKSDALTQGGTEKASFTFNGKLDSPYKAVYPASAVVSTGNTTAGIDLPAIQNSYDGKFDRNSCILVGKSEGNNISLSHTMAYIAFVFEKDGTDAVLSSLEITAAGGEKLCGGFTTDYTSISAKGDASSDVTVICNTTVGSGTAITAAIPGQNYEKGFDILVRDTEGRTMSRSAKGSFNAAAGHFYTTTLSYQPDAEYPDRLYIAGSAMEWGWDPKDPRAVIPEMEDGIYRGDFTFNFGESGENGFKFWETDEYGTEYGMTVDSEFGNIGFDLRADITGAPDGDPQFYLGQKGYKSGGYTLVINLNTKSLTLLPAGVPQTLYMSGGFNGWEAVPMERIDEGKFRVENIDIDFYNGEGDPKGHGIKFFENSDWSNQWGPKEDWENTDYRGWELAPYADAPQFYPQLAGFESGNYTVLVDFTTMTMSLTPVAGEPVTLKLLSDKNATIQTENLYANMMELIGTGGVQCSEHKCRPYMESITALPGQPEPTIQTGLTPKT